MCRAWWAPLCHTGGMTDTNPVITRVEESTGTLVLNRPRALNALNREMVEAISVALSSWSEDPAITQVLIESSHPRAFSSGGDVKAARAGILAGSENQVDEFFAAEYSMNKQVAAFPKPFIALIDGLDMGGGLGVSAHGSHRVVTGNASAAMPESNIGYSCDVGMSHVFRTMTGTRGAPSMALGIFLAATGWRLNPAEMIWTGLATHAVEAAELPRLRADIIRLGIEEALGQSDGAWGGDAEKADPRGALPEAFCENRLAPLADPIEDCFVGRSWSAITERLAGRLRGVVNELTAHASPTSLEATTLLLATPAAEVSEAIDREARVAAFMRRRNDFVEGVGAVLVTKGASPRFSPAAPLDELRALL